MLQTEFMRSGRDRLFGPTPSPTEAGAWGVHSMRELATNMQIRLSIFVIRQRRTRNANHVFSALPEGPLRLKSPTHAGHRKAHLRRWDADSLRSRRLSVPLLSMSGPGARPTAAGPGGPHLCEASSSSAPPVQDQIAQIKILSQ